MTRLFLLGVASLFVGHSAQAATFVVVPNANTAVAGVANTFGVLGNGGAGLTFQTGVAASQLGGIALGSTITSIGFRLNERETTIAQALNYSQYQIEIGSAANTVGAFSLTFADNMGANTIVARTGPLTIAGGSLTGGSTVNPFYQIGFMQGFVYTGGPLAVTIRFDGNPSAMVSVDAITGGSVLQAVFAQDSAATTGTGSSFNAPVIRFGIGEALVPGPGVPEPATWAMMLLGFGFIGFGLRRRANVNARIRFA